MTNQASKVLQGDCLDKLKELADNSVDSIVTDPPYELGFMGKSWDNTGIANNSEMWAECLRVLKPGGHLLSFGGTRTYHRMACAIEDAGFEIRDMLEWIFASGFPKSQNIGKMYDKKMGNKREMIKEYKTHDIRNNSLLGKKGSMAVTQTKGISSYEGLGTALKPAHEPIVCARKPLSEKTVVDNVIKWGTGGINIDESRVGTTGGETHKGGFQKRYVGDKVDYENHGVESDLTPKGRFPANLIHDNSEEVRECFPETGKSSGGRIGNKGSALNMMGNNYEAGNPGFGDSGNASRFFKSIIYQAKASKSERNKGCKDLEKGCFHPTVKPLALMRYLVTLVSRRGQTVLDPFAGSGTTLVACKELGRNYIGIELEEEYIPIIKARLKATKELVQIKQVNLFENNKI